MDEQKYKAFVARLIPPQGAPLSAYISAASRALGGRTDSDLARTIGVPVATLASWKKRGAVPDDRITWFTTTLVPKIAEYRSDLPDVSNTARAATVELLTRTSGNPMRIERFPVFATANMLGAILAVAEFLVEVEGIEPRTLNSKTVERITDLLEVAMLEFRATLGPAYFSVGPQ